MNRRLLGLVTALTLGVETAEAQEPASLALSDIRGTEVALAQPVVGSEGSLLRFEAGSSLMLARPLAGASVLTASLFQNRRLAGSGSREPGATLRMPTTGGLGLPRHGIVGHVSAVVSGSEHPLVGTVAQAVLGAAGGYLLMSMGGSSNGSKGSGTRVDPNPRTVNLKFKIRF